MKSLALIFSLLLAGCAANAMPPAHRPMGVVVTVPPGTPPDAVVNIYSAQMADTNWSGPVSLKVVGNSVTNLIAGTPAELYTSTIIVNGNQSDYGSIATNVPAPATSIIPQK